MKARAKPRARARLGGLFLALLAGAGAASSARADGLADLKAALARLQARTPVKAMLAVTLTKRHGEGAQAEEQDGQAGVGLEDGPRGLQVTYAPEMLARMDGEARQLGRDANAKTPTLLAFEQLNAADYLPLLSAAGHLARALDEGRYKGERSDTLAGAPARVLSFEIPIAHLPDAERKYVKKFDGHVDVWIAPDGTPLASNAQQNGSGSAYVVISFEWHQQDERRYTLVGDRLVTLREEMRITTRGAGDSGQTHVVKTLQVVP